LSSDRFLKEFGVGPPTWEVISPGRAAVLRLIETGGALDLGVVYFATGTPGDIPDSRSPEAHGEGRGGNATPIQLQRRVMREAVANALQPARKALSVISGDFNWTAEADGRWSKVTVNDSVFDPAEELHWTEVTTATAGLFELPQPCCTCETGLARSRLDRVYTNYPVVDQLDKQLAALALPWQVRLSAHRPVSFFRITKRQQHEENRPLAGKVLNDGSWPLQTAILFHSDKSGGQDTPLGKLRLLKKAMREAASRIELGQKNTKIDDEQPEDKLGFTMRTLRAAEKGLSSLVARLAQNYTGLLELGDQSVGFLMSAEGLEALRKHALDCAKDHIKNQIKNNLASPRCANGSPFSNRSADSPRAKGPYSRRFARRKAKSPRTRRAWPRP
jgi:hypothetical protein